MKKKPLNSVSLTKPKKAVKKRATAVSLVEPTVSDLVIDNDSLKAAAKNEVQITTKRVAVKIKATDPRFIPMYKSKDAACADLVANIPEGIIRLAPGQVVKVDCGFSMALPSGWEAQIRARSHLAEKGIQVTNSPGTIDADYRGPVSVILNNSGREIVNLEHGKRFAQMALKPVWFFAWNIVSELDVTERGEGGYGSTGTE